ncbi:MAG: SURF1 family protein [Pseudomonadota bacterium]
MSKASRASQASQASSRRTGQGRETGQETGREPDQAQRRGRGVWVLTIAALTAFAILVTLGTWQLQRLAWKEDLIARLEAGARADPVDVAAIAKRLQNGEKLEDVRFRPVSVAGTFDHAREFHVWAGTSKGGPAWQVVTPLRLVTALPGRKRYDTRYVLVIRGVVPERAKAAQQRAGGQPQGPQQIVGRVRLGAPGSMFAPAPSQTRNRWFRLDIAGMRRAIATAFVEGSASGTPDEAIMLTLPFFIEAYQASPGTGAPKPRLSGINLRNRHFSYALTWYGLAATLLAIYALMVHARLRRTANA